MAPSRPPPPAAPPHPADPPPAGVARPHFSLSPPFPGAPGPAPGVGGPMMLLPREASPAPATGTLLWIVLRNRRIGGIVGMALLPTLGVLEGEPRVKLFGACAL